MNTAFHHNGYGKAANDPSSGNKAPLDGNLVAVLASRASVLAAAAAMGHEVPDEETAKKTGNDEPADETAAEKKKRGDRTYRETERQEDAKAGIKPCPVKFPVDLHQALRQRANEIYAPEGSRALLAFTAFTLRQELTDILHAIELRADREDFLEALQVIVQQDWLAKTAICLSTVGPKPPTALHAHIPRLVDAMVRSAEVLSAILTVTSNPTLQKLCAAIGDKPQMQAQFLDMAMHARNTEFLSRMLRLSPADREFLLKLLDLDQESKQAIAGAAQHPRIIRMVLSAARNRVVHDAIQTAAHNPAIARTGLAIIGGKGIVGWIARKATDVLLRRQQKLKSI